MPGPYPNSDEEDLARRAALQARELARRAFGSLGSPRRSQRSQPSSTSPSDYWWNVPSHPHALSEVPNRQDSTPKPDSPLVSPKSPSREDKSLSVDSEPRANSPFRENTSLSPHSPLKENTSLSPRSSTRESTPLSPKTMSNSANTPAKGGKKGGDTKYDLDNVLPLVLAVLGNPSLNYKNMEIMDPEHRTAVAWQHRFRAWKTKGKEIADAHPSITDASTSAAAPKKRAPAAKKDAGGKGKAKQDDVGDEEDNVDDEEVDDVKVKQENTDNGAESEMSPPTAKGKGKGKKAAPTNATKTGESVNTPNGGKKRGSDDMTADADNEETPAKKAKGAKKGTAKTVKKTAAKDQGEENDSPVEEANGKGKGKAKAKPKAKAAPKMKAVNEAEPGLAGLQNPSDLQLDEHVFDPELVGVGEEGMTEMKFEEEV